MGNLILVSDLTMCQIAFGVSSKAHQTALFHACHISSIPTYSMGHILIQKSPSQQPKKDCV